MRKAHLLVTLALVCCTTYTMACTNFLFTKGATKDGSTMVTYSADYTFYTENCITGPHKTGLPEVCSMSTSGTPVNLWVKSRK